MQFRLTLNYCVCINLLIWCFGIATDLETVHVVYRIEKKVSVESMELYNTANCILSGKNCNEKVEFYLL